MAPVEIALLFAEYGFHVFPLYHSKSNHRSKPYGWAKNKVIDPEHSDKVIPASKDPDFIKTWDDQVARIYKSTVSGFGILGEDCIIIDIDNKNGSDGTKSFLALSSNYGIPKPTMVTTTKSGGLHAFYRRPVSMSKDHIKTVAGAVADSHKYEGIDVRGNTGFVVGPESIADHDAKPEYEAGRYICYRPTHINNLPEFPDRLARQWTRTAFKDDLDSMVMDVPDSDDYKSKIRRGIIPEFIPKGGRNEAFYLFANVLKSRGVTESIAREMMIQMSKVVEEPETFSDSVNIDEIISRVFVVNKENPYDIAVDLLAHGLIQLTNYKSKLHYVILEDNPYIMSRVPHDESSMKSLLSGFQRSMQSANGKEKIVNPMEVIVRTIRDENRADTLGFRPNAGTIFSLHDDAGATRYLNTYKPVTIFKNRINDLVWKEFMTLVSRIFGPEGTDEFQLGLDFIAWMLQQPHIKPVIAPFIMSHNRGVGKSLFFNTVIQILGTSKAGQRQGRLTKLDEIQGRFFDPSGCVINLIDEVQFPVHKDTRKESVTFWRHLKNLITAEVVSVEIKGGATHQVPNSAALMLAGNTGSHFPIEEMDRRLWIIDANPPLLERGLCDNLFALTKGINVGPDDRVDMVNTLRNELMNHKIVHDLSIIRAPMTDIKRDLFMNSLTDIEDWFIRHFENEDNLFAASPIISESAFIYVAETSDYLVGSKWRENIYNLFRDFKRRGYLRPVRSRSDSSVSRNMVVPRVGSDGQLYQTDKREVLYTTRDHGTFDNEDNKTVMHAFMRNAHTIKVFKGNIKKSVVQDKWEESNAGQV